MVDILCLRCKKNIPESLLGGKRAQTARYCSGICRNADYSEKQQKTSIQRAFPHLSTATVGSINEMLVCIDLLRRGFSVYREVSPGNCDLAVVLNNKLYRVEVTTGTFNASGKLSYPKKNTDNFDFLAVVTLGDIIHYFPEIEKIK